MNAEKTIVTKWIPIVRGEFEEMPGLHLSKRQAQRLWGLDAATCDRLLDALVANRFLRLTSAGAYALADTR